MDKYLHIRSIKRVTADGELEELNFNTGVNVLCGKPNVGKTTWLKQLDYILGKNANIADVFADDELARKYVELTAVLDINGEEITITRKPYEIGSAGKVFLNDQPVTVTDFSEEILKKIHIPENVKFPKGNPYTSQWVEISFRTIYRHMYRQETMWSDIADKQPPNDQLAAQFLLFGIAQSIYSGDYDQKVSNEKKLILLEAQKTQYTEILNRVVQEMSPKGEEQLHYATETEVEFSIASIETELTKLEEERNAIVEKRIAEINEQKQLVVSQETELINKKIGIIKQIENSATFTGKLEKKMLQYVSIRETLADETSKLKRTKKSGVIADMKISHCPACDQELLRQKKEKNDEQCFLCSQPMPEANLVLPTVNRLDFELAQLESEKKEIAELIDSLQKDIDQQKNSDKYLQEQLYYVELEIKPLKESLFTLSYQDLSEIDVKRGRLQEQIQNYHRLKTNINYKNKLESDIQTLKIKIDREKTKQEQELDIINFAKIARDMEDGMKLYISRIAKNKEGRDVWTNKGQVSVGLNEAKVSYHVKNKPWESLGGNDKEIFLLAYHFGLLNLTERNGYNFPGLLIIDLPPELGEAQKGSYNYVVDPFAKYCKVFSKKKHLQVIFAGRSFEGITDVNVIELDKAWK
jgi:hypothetical protein